MTVVFIYNQITTVVNKQVAYKSTTDQELPGAGRCCVLYSFTRRQQLPAQIDIAAIIVCTKLRHGCRLKITRLNKKSDYVSQCIFSAKFHPGPI